VEEDFGTDAPAGKKMTEVGASRMNNGNLAYVLRIFGRPPRTTACDCERVGEPALPQTLFRMTDPVLARKLTMPTSRGTQLAKDKTVSDEKLVEELFLSTLTRFPDDKEKATALKYLADEGNRLVGSQELVWALINTREFILNH
jgi:transcriptional regulator GlxA family with amidase domain